MYITEIVINGFKSYREKTVIGGFDQRCNVFVGRNGSGKSNFFSAVEFVLSDEYKYLQKEGRLDLINKTTIHPSTTAYVELAFDMGQSSSDTSRQGNVSRVRRTISLNKDQFTIDGRNASWKEVQEFLFSSTMYGSSPYYIVKQGKINQLATARPKQLLELLYEVAGIKSLDESTTHSLDCLGHAQETLKIAVPEQKLLDMRLATLAEEKAELEQYEALDKKHRALQYMVYRKEQQNAIDALNSLDCANKKFQKEQRESLQEMKECEQNVARLQQSCEENQKKLSEAAAQKAKLREEYYKMEKQKTTFELRVRDMMDELYNQAEHQKDVQEHMNSVNNQIAKHEVELQKVSLQIEDNHAREDQLHNELRAKKLTRSVLLKKKMRAVQFSNQTDRDQWLQSEVGKVRKQIDEKRALLNETRTEYDKLRQEIGKNKDNYYNGQRNMIEMLERETQYKVHLFGQIKYKNQAGKLGDELMAAKVLAMQKLKTLKEELCQLELKMQKRMGNATYMGWKSVKKLISKLKARGGDLDSAGGIILNGYYGIVMDKLECEQGLQLPTETAAGGKLFHHIVESDTVAKEIIRMCNRENMPGNFNFMPLNRLQPSNARYPADDNARPLISLLKFDQPFELVFQRIFGHVLLCDDLEAAATAGRKGNLSCVTYDGDLVRTGVFTGGFRESVQSMMALYQSWNEMDGEMDKLADELQTMIGDEERNRASMATYEKNIIFHERKLEKLRANIAKVQFTQREWPMLCRRLEDDCAYKERKMRMYEADCKLLETNVEGLVSELGTQLTSEELSEDEQRRIDTVNAEIRSIQKLWQQTVDAGRKATLKKQTLQDILHSKLFPQRDELIASLERIVHSKQSHLMETYREQERLCKNEVISLLRDIEGIDKTINELTKKDESLGKAMGHWKGKLRSAEEKLANVSPTVKPIDSRRQELEQRIDMYTGKIEALGALPAIDPAYETMALARLIKELNLTKTNLKKFANVNKKALEQYTKHVEISKQLDMQRRELTEIPSKINDSLHQLMAQRHEYIESMLQQVNQHFSEVFTKFVPTGCAKLVLLSADLGEKRKNRRSDDWYDGLGLDVSFVGKTSRVTEMKQLSGGQKTLVAVALIFAIQKFKPAPFYLFDEIDQALDSKYRKALASVMRDLSESSQFITITFRKELLEYAHKFYHVRCANERSHVEEIAQPAAYKFLVDDPIRRGRNIRCPIMPI